MSLPRRTLLHAAAVASLSSGLLVLPAAAEAGVAVAPSTQLTASLGALLTPSNASALSAQVASFVASPRTSYLGVIDNLINGDAGHNVISAPRSSAPTAPALEGTLGALGALTPPAPSAAQQQAATELYATVLGAGLSPLLNAVNSANAGNAVNQLAALQKLVPGATVPAGSLSAVAGILTGLAASSSAAGALNAAASTLNASTGITPDALRSVAAQLAAVTDSTQVGSSGVTVAQTCAALASGIDGSGTLLGALGTFGLPLAPAVDPGDDTTALTQLANLSTVAPGANASLPQIATVLNAVAALPAIGGTSAAAPLSAAAGTLAGAFTPTQTFSLVTNLTAAAPALPAPLSSLVSGLATALSTSGATFGTVTGLSTANATEALGELSTLAGLGAGSSTSTLPGISAVLNQVSSDIPAADANESAGLSDLVSILSSDSLDSAHLSGAAQALGYIASALPAPVATTIGDLATSLNTDAVAMTPRPAPSPVSANSSSGSGPAASGSSSTGSGSSSNTSGASSGSGSSGDSSGAGSSSSANLNGPTAATPLQKAVRNGNRITLTLSCAAARAKHCSDTISAAEAGAHTVRLHARLSGHSTRTVTLTLPAGRGHGGARATRRRPAIIVTVVSGHRRVRRTLA